MPEIKEIEQSYLSHGVVLLPTNALINSNDSNDKFTSVTAARNKGHS